VRSAYELPSNNIKTIQQTILATISRHPRSSAGSLC